MRYQFRLFGVFIVAVSSGCLANRRYQADQSQSRPDVVLLQRKRVSYSYVELGVNNTTAQEKPKVPSLLVARSALCKAVNRTLNKQWARWIPRQPFRPPVSALDFLSSVMLFDWCLFAGAITLLIILHMFMQGRRKTKHVTVLMIWILVGLLCNAVIWLRFGGDIGISWFVGYLLELIFLVENVFVFQILIQAFKTPDRLTTKALQFVVWGQIAFELFFFMGLAAWLRSFKALPYLLGIWLIFFGYVAARGGPLQEVDVMETCVCRTFIWVLGERLSPTYEMDGKILLTHGDGKVRVTLLGLVISMLLLADFLLEIDVVLVKIEELPNPYIGFTSSAVAAFAIPQAYFVTKNLLKGCVTLKYGIAGVLMLFGVQLLLSSIYIIQPAVACVIIFFVLVSCCAASVLISCCGVDRARSHGPKSDTSTDSWSDSQQERPREQPTLCVSPYAQLSQKLARETSETGYDSNADNLSSLPSPRSESGSSPEPQEQPAEQPPDSGGSPGSQEQAAEQPLDNGSSPGSQEQAAEQPTDNGSSPGSQEQQGGQLPDCGSLPGSQEQPAEQPPENGSSPGSQGQAAEQPTDIGSSPGSQELPTEQPLDCGSSLGSQEQAGEQPPDAGTLRRG